MTDVNNEPTKWNERIQKWEEEIEKEEEEKNSCILCGLLFGSRINHARSA